MFDKSPDQRLSAWSSFRKGLDSAADPLSLTARFWSDAPLVVHNNKIDPYNAKSWPSPWEIIYENRYDDFTLAMMIGLTLKLTEKFKDEQIEIRTMVDQEEKQLYNLVYINEKHVLNYERGMSLTLENIKSDLYLENLVELKFPR